MNLTEDTVYNLGQYTLHSTNKQEETKIIYNLC